MHNSTSGSTENLGALAAGGGGAAAAAGGVRVRRKNLKKGFQFTLMVVGASGLGRSTFVNTLCGQSVLARTTVDDPPKTDSQETVKIQPTVVELDEDGVKLSLTVIDTPGFGDALDNEKSFSEILNYIELQYDEILAQESRIKRNPKFQDNRVHALLYFIVPTGHSLRELDIQLMRRLGPRVNVIPVIGKADTLTTEELAVFKKRIMEDIAHYKIPIFDFPFDPEEDDEDTVAENTQLRALLPFAVIGAEGEYMVDGHLVRGRKYPWGVGEVDNENHCDFARLRCVLLSSHLNDLKQITHDVLYEQYRTEKLSQGEDEAQRLITEEQLAREAEKLREKEAAIAKEMNEKRQELLAKEEALRNLELRLTGSHDSLDKLAL